MPKIGPIMNISPQDPEEDYLSQHMCFTKKHYGETWRQVVEEDPSYVMFLLMDAEDFEFTDKRLEEELTWALEEMGL